MQKGKPSGSKNHIAGQLPLREAITWPYYVIFRSSSACLRVRCGCHAVMGILSFGSGNPGTPPGDLARAHGLLTSSLHSLINIRISTTG